MKARSVLLVGGLLLFGLTSVFANGAKTEKIKVYGNCGMCKTRIEKAAKSVTGVSGATWNSEDLMLTVTFDDSKTTVLKIEESVAKVGHDTDHARADDKTYSALPGCCQYDRPEKK